MKNLSLLIIALLFVSCSTQKTLNQQLNKEMKLVSKKNYLKKYTKRFINSIPSEDIELLTKDTIVITYDTVTQ